MSQSADLDRARRAAALRRWKKQCRTGMQQINRYPEIDFYSDHWPIRSMYGTKMEDIALGTTLSAFSNLDRTYSTAVRCMAAERAIADGTKNVTHEFYAWRLLAETGPESLLDIRRSHLQELETSLVRESTQKPSSASSNLNRLSYLASFLDRLVRLEIIEPIAWRISNESRGILKELEARHRSEFRIAKALILDRQIEALGDAMSALFQVDPRLAPYDRSALALMGVIMGAPSRVNEPLCMTIDDFFEVEKYAARSDESDSLDELGRAHMLLLQKGSKGAKMSAKPALNFMIDLLRLCVQILIDGGKRSRMLALWYEKNPGKLYLPPSLEHLRNQVLGRADLWRVMQLSDRTPTTSEINLIKHVWNQAAEQGKVLRIKNPLRGKIKRVRLTLQAVAWDDLEKILLFRVHESMASARQVTPSVRYEGLLSKMLVLFDSAETPYLPDSIKYGTMSMRFKQTDIYRERNRVGRKSGGLPTIFEKLDLKMVLDGKTDFAWIETHDPRRWLTTQALLAKEALSDVLINKWANRCNIEQLKHYDLRSDIQKADQATMPSTAELTDISLGLKQLGGLEAEYGLGMEIISTTGVGISVTSMDLIASAVDDRPIARTSNQIIILYSSRFGVCLHQHHETPCRAYSCMPCSENLVIKGHLPTNEEVRKRHALLTGSIVRQLDRLVVAHNREIADCPEGLEAHMLHLVREGLTVEQMADELIAQFHEIKDLVKSTSFRNRLEEAFVARGMVQRLDSPDVTSGALMRYHNPSRHASPGHERALDSLGGRVAIDARLDQFHQQHPQFAPTSLGLKDERELLEEDDGDDDDDE